MQRRTLSPVRALWAAGLLLGTFAGAGARGDDQIPAPGADLVPKTVDILAARKAGDLSVTVRGQGESHVKFSLRNTTAGRLKVIIPPGLVASAGVGQGFQSMGLGTPTTSNGSFGQYKTASTRDGGFRSVGTAAPDEGIALNGNQAVEFTLPSVCLNYGIPTPTPRDVFTLMDVDDYTPDVRVRKALRSLATLGTSQGVAQAVMWHVCNGLTYDQLAAQAAKQLNLHEITLAARFVEALDASGSTELVDPSALTQARILVRLQGEGSMQKEMRRISSELEGQRVLGLPVEVVTELPTNPSSFAALHLNVAFSLNEAGNISGRVNARQALLGAGWVPLGSSSFKLTEELSGTSLADAVDRAVGSTFVTAKPDRRTTGSTRLRIDNRLPFTVAGVVIRTGRGENAGSVSFDRLGVGPGRSGQATIPAAHGYVERVVLNGL